MKSLLGRAEVDRLAAILDENAVSGPLMQTALDFQAKFSPGQEAFRAGLSLAVLLLERLLSPPQRLVALFCIADVHIETHDILKDPFLQYLVISTSKLVPLEAERHFALMLLRRLQSQIQHMSAVKFLSTFRESRPIVSDDLIEFETAATALNAASMSLNPMRNLAVSDSISPFQLPHKATMNSVTVKGDEIPVPSLMPEFPRPPPRLCHSVQDDFDHMWLDLYPYHELIWDYSKDMDATREAEIKQLISRAMEETLPVASLDTLKQLLRDDPQLLGQCDLSPKRFPELVEKNPQVATAVLLQTISSPNITEFFSVLVNMDMSLHSMEVVNKLTTSVNLPQEFVHLYISNCIASCEQIKDKFLQTRLVRLLCVFLTSLIRNNVIRVQDIFIEVQAFCIDFSHIREAAGLFRLLKTLEPQLPNSNGTTLASDDIS